MEVLPHCLLQFRVCVAYYAVASLCLNVLPVAAKRRSHRRQ